MTTAEMKDRRKTFSAAVVQFARSLPQDVATSHIAWQLVKSGTFVGANYRSSCRAKSTADFISKMTTVEEEADETAFWLELGNSGRQTGGPATYEGDQIVRIVVASIRTSRGRSG